MSNEPFAVPSEHRKFHPCHGTRPTHTLAAEIPKKFGKLRRQGACRGSSVMFSTIDFSLYTMRASWIASGMRGFPGVSTIKYNAPKATLMKM
jgi:hypothetical protein